MPILIMWYLSPERISNRLARHLQPHPPTKVFENIVAEIAIALGEPVENIQVSDCSVANVAMLPCSDREIVVATTGALERLDRYELQALVAAQFAGMRDRWCRLATRAEILWWLLLWILGFSFLLSWFLDGPIAFTYSVFYLFALFAWGLAPRWIEQARDLCADVVAVQKTLEPKALARAMRKLAEQASSADEVQFGSFLLPSNPFIVLPRRINVRKSSSIGRWSSTDEVRLELLLRADRAEAMANGENPSDFTGREYRRRWRLIGKGK
ncbi:hypothetical protein [Marinobacter sp. CHS3-4]|uniref:hypothetical protein n=1 Tax=Marinobacter sp. CHS3-4 TaxID=3045174 RepID=UPI0024B5B442|nr:hypothetical protein [Marinobacter sp. CHS3-4]MDI9246572.1 hypothetical protein [Marinobacter sp. CHS3-4]